MDANDRVGVLQTHNEKGESCGVIIRVQDLDDDIQRLIESPKLEGQNA
jgi:hypothetical protein